MDYLKMSRRNAVSVSDGSQCDSDLETLKSAIAAKPTLYWPTGSMVSCLSHTDSWQQAWTCNTECHGTKCQKKGKHRNRPQAPCKKWIRLEDAASLMEFNHRRPRPMYEYLQYFRTPNFVMSGSKATRRKIHYSRVTLAEASGPRNSRR